MEARGAWCWTVLRGVRATGAILVDIARVLQEATRDHHHAVVRVTGRLAAWTSHLDNITDEVQSLIHHRDTWHTVSEIGAANPTVVANPFVMGHFNTLYYRRTLVPIRAMVDPNNDSDSLLTLPTDIAAHPRRPGDYRRGADSSRRCAAPAGGHEWACRSD